MARFDVYRLRSGELAVDCQSDELDQLSSRFVAPLRAGDDISIGIRRLNPRFTIEGRNVIMATHLSRAIDRRDIAATLATLAEHHDAIIDALDVLITGI